LVQQDLKVVKLITKNIFGLLRFSCLSKPFCLQETLPTEPTNLLSKAHISPCEYQDSQSNERSKHFHSFEKSLCFPKFVHIFQPKACQAWLTGEQFLFLTEISHFNKGFCIFSWKYHLHFFLKLSPIFSAV